MDDKKVRRKLCVYIKGLTCVSLKVFLFGLYLFIRCFCYSYAWRRSLDTN